jgi:hypothetical protein
MVYCCIAGSESTRDVTKHSFQQLLKITIKWCIAVLLYQKVIGMLRNHPWHSCKRSPSNGFIAILLDQRVLGMLRTHNYCNKSPSSPFNILFYSILMDYSVRVSQNHSEWHNSPRSSSNVLYFTDETEREGCHEITPKTTILKPRKYLMSRKHP